MVISKKTIIFQGLRGGPTFSREIRTFFKGGIQILILSETHITFDCAAAQAEENSLCFHCETSGLLRVVKELSLSKRSNEVRVYISSLGMRSENFMGMVFYEPHIKPNIL